MSMTNGLEAVKLAERFEIGFLEGSRLEREAPQDVSRTRQMSLGGGRGALICVTWCATLQLLHQIVRTQEQLKNDQHGRMIVGRGETDRCVLSCVSLGCLSADLCCSTSSDVEAADTLTALVLSLSARTVATAGPILSISEEANKLYEDQDESCAMSVLCFVCRVRPLTSPHPARIQTPSSSLPSPSHPSPFSRPPRSKLL